MKIKWNISGGIKYKDLILYYVEKYNLTEKYDITVLIHMWTSGLGVEVNVFIMIKIVLKILCKNIIN